MLLVGQFSTQTPQPLHFWVSTSIAPLNAIILIFKVLDSVLLLLTKTQ